MAERDDLVAVGVAFERLGPVVGARLALCRQRFEAEALSAAFEEEALVVRGGEVEQVADLGRGQA